MSIFTTSGFDVYGGHGQGAGVPASSTYYICPFVNGLQALSYSFPIPVDGILQNLFVRLATAQPGTGSLQVQIWDFSLSLFTGIGVTIPAGGASDTYSDLVNQYGYTAGNLIQVRLINNATSVSATLGGVSWILRG